MNDSGSSPQGRSYGINGGCKQIYDPRFYLVLWSAQEVV